MFKMYTEEEINKMSCEELRENFIKFVKNKPITEDFLNMWWYGTTQIPQSEDTGPLGINTTID